MKTLLVIFAFIFPSMVFNDYNLPKTWDKDFVITLDHHGSMNGGFTDLKFTYDSCVYTTGSNNSPEITTFYLMKEKDRAAILGKLHSLKIDKVKPESTFVPVHDGWSESICFDSHCIQGGPSVEMKEHDKNTYQTAYAYLEQFAIDNAKKKKKK